MPQATIEQRNLLLCLTVIIFSQYAHLRSFPYYNLHGGKYGRNKRASRKRKRKYYGKQKLEVEVETESVPVELDQPLDEVMQEENTTPMSASEKKKRILMSLLALNQLNVM